MKTRHLVRLMARIRRDLRSYRPRPAPPPVPELCTEARAELLLAELARRHQEGATLDVRDLQAAGQSVGIPKYHCALYRRWLESLQRWPYAESAGFAAGRRA
jgi:hypothetical protein